jgi:geranylgeranyl diphosphate synthase type II
MLVIAYDYLMKSSSPRLLEIIKLFNQMAIQVCEGQQMDMNFEQAQAVTIADYLKMIELKTAVLVATSLQIGALNGNASSRDAALIYDFGKNLGIAFQLQDDILDAFGDPEKFGKKPGGDIAQNKKTFLYLKALEIADQHTGAKLQELFAGNDVAEAAKISAVLDIFVGLDIKAIAEQEKERYWQESLESLRQINISPIRKKVLEQFASMLMRRES